MIIIDGNNQLNRVLCLPSYYGLSFGGKLTGGIYGFLKTLNNSTIGKGPKEKIIVVWDSKHSERRKRLYPEYKANRIPKTDQEKQIKEDYFKSFNPQKKSLQDEFLPSLGVLSISHQDKEGDDLIYRLCEMYHDKEKIMVISEDKDMMQLITYFPSVKLRRPIADLLITNDNFKEAAGVPKELYLLFKAFCGDASDNIKGIHGVGETTITKLFNNLKATTHDEAIKEILRDAKEKYDKSKDKEKLTREAKIYTGWGVVAKNLELVDLSREEFTNSDLILIKESIDNFNPKVYTDYFKSLCMNHGFESILNNFNFFVKCFE